MSDLIHTHLHTTFSIGDGFGTPEQHIETAKERGATALAITDHGSVSGHIRFQKAAQDAGIKPIFGCLLAGQEIVTIDGVKNVEDIQSGDLVLTHKGRFRKVRRIMQREYRGLVYEIELNNRYSRKLRLTEEHPVLIFNGDGVRWLKPNEIDFGRIKKTDGGIENWHSFVCFPKIKGFPEIKIDINDFLPANIISTQEGTKKTKKNHKRDSLHSWSNISNDFILDEDFAYLLGIFCAEGSFNKTKGRLNGGIIFSLHIEEEFIYEKIKKIAWDKFNLVVSKRDRPERKSKEVWFSNLPLAYVLEGMCGSGAKNKKVPRCIFESQTYIRDSFFQGLIDGDGKKITPKCKQGALRVVSRNLAWGAKVLLGNGGHWSSVTFSKDKKSGRSYYHVTYNTNREYLRIIHDDNFLYKPIKNITSSYENTVVYNFEVEEDNSYVSDFVLHNCEIYVVDDIAEMLEKKTQRKYHLTLLAKNQIGYNNLLKIATEANRHFYYKPTTTLKDIVDLELTEGLVVLSGCMFGELSQLVLKDKEAFADRYWQMKDIWGEDFYLEIQHFDFKEVKEIAKKFMKFSPKDVVATCDVHWPRAEHRLVTQIVRWVGKNKENADQTEMHQLTADEVLKYFDSHKIPGVSRKRVIAAIEKTGEIAEKCNVTIPTAIMPKFNTGSDMTARESLEIWAYDGLKTRGLDNQEYRDRLEYELKIVCEKGFEDYILIVAGLIRNAKNAKKIMTGPARGSSGGSLLCYLVGITEIDPIRFGLLFERFIDVVRIDFPDIDTDFEDERREEVKKYLVEKYGEDKTCSIGTFTTFKAKNIIDDITRVYNAEAGREVISQDVRMAAKRLIGDDPNATLSGALESSEELRQLFIDHPEFKYATLLEKQIRNKSVHPAGFIVSAEPINKFTSLDFDKGKRLDDPIAPISDRDAVEVGLIKIDLLGLKVLSVMRRILEKIGMTPQELYKLPLDDPEVMRGFTDGNLLGVFQFEGMAAREVCQKIRPDTFLELAHINAIARPGPLGSNMDQAYAKIKFGQKQLPNIHPILTEITKETYGQYIYQEQAMRIVKEIGDFDWGEVNKFRKAIAKKKDHGWLQEMKEKFVTKAFEKGMKLEDASKIYDDLLKFGSYGFNKCVSGDTVLLKSGANQYSGAEITVKEFYDAWLGKKGKNIRDAYKYRGLNVLTYDDNSDRIIPKRIKGVFYQGMQSVYRIITKGGRELVCTSNHRSLTNKGWLQTDQMIMGDLLKVHLGYENQKYKFNPVKDPNKKYGSRCGFPEGEFNPGYNGGYFTELESVSKELPAKCEECGKRDARLERAHLDGDRKNNLRDNVKMLCAGCHKKHDYQNNGRIKRWQKGHLTGWDEITEINYAGEEDVYDVEMEEPHNFIANGIVTHNSHAVAYSVLAYYTMYMKVKHSHIFYWANLVKEDHKFDQRTLLKEYLNNGGIVFPFDFNLSKKSWEIETVDGVVGLRPGFLQLDGVGDTNAEEVVNKQPYDDMKDLENKVVKRVVNKKVRAKIEAMLGETDIFGIEKLKEDTTKAIMEYSLLDWWMPVKELLELPEKPWTLLVGKLSEKKRKYYSNTDENGQATITEYTKMFLEDYTGSIFCSISSGAYNRIKNEIWDAEDDALFVVCGYKSKRYKNRFYIEQAINITKRDKLVCPGLEALEEYRKRFESYIFNAKNVMKNKIETTDEVYVGGVVTNMISYDNPKGQVMYVTVQDTLFMWRTKVSADKLRIIEKANIKLGDVVMIKCSKYMGYYLLQDIKHIHKIKDKDAV